MPTLPRRRVLVALLLLGVPAHASALGEENITLAAILAQATAQVRALTDSLATARRTYDETRRYVGMLDDARQAFAAFQRQSTALVSNPLAGVDDLFPDASYLRRELTAPDRWAAGTGALQESVRTCIGGSGPTACVTFHKELQDAQARQAIADTMGKAPAGRADIAAVDSEAAVAIAGAHNFGNRAHAEGAALAKLQAICEAGTTPEAMAACQGQAAALSAKQLGTLNEQMAESVRLQAVQAAAQNADRKREVEESTARNRAVQAGFRDMTRTRLQGTSGPGALP